MKINIKKYILGFFLLTISTDPSNAIGVAVGPSFGLSGNYDTFSLKDPSCKLMVLTNKACQLGVFGKVDLWLLYVKLDALLVLEWSRLPKVNRYAFQYITLPFSVGIPFFNVIRPHIGLIFRMPLSASIPFKENMLLEKYQEKINSYLFGIGIDLGKFLIDFDFERAFASLPIRAISSILADGERRYTPKKFSLKVGYNLLG